MQADAMVRRQLARHITGFELDYDAPIVIMTPDTIDIPSLLGIGADGNTDVVSSVAGEEPAACGSCSEFV